MKTFTDLMQDMDCVALAQFCGPIVALVVWGILMITKSRGDKLQVGSSKASLSSIFKLQTCKETPLSSIRSSGKHRKSRSDNKNQNSKKNKANLHAKNNQCNKSLSDFSTKDYFRSDIHPYEQRITSSTFEDNLTSCCEIKNRKKTSIDAVGIQEKLPIRQHRRKILNNTKVIRMDIEQQNKEIAMQTSSIAVQSLRKQCTKAAALKAALKNSQISKMLNHGQSSLESKKPFEGSLSSASSTTSLSSSISLSASSSPTHSANSSPTASPMANKRYGEFSKKRSFKSILPLRQFTKLNMNEQELVQQMKRYVIDPSLLRIYGFPVESVRHEGCVEIYKCLPKHLAEEAVTKDNQRHHRHFYGRKKIDIINDCDGLSSSFGGKKWMRSSTADSGHGSGESSPRFTDSDSGEMSDEDTVPPIMAFYTPDGVYQIFSEYCNSIEKQCVRCFKMFRVNEKGEYLSFDSCTYHWGKLNNVYDGKCCINTYTCCQGEEFSEGCSTHHLHVWNGVVVGINGPYTGFLHTQHKKTNLKHSKIYAIDCEMSYTGLGLEVTKVTVVSFDGSLVYEHFVQPQAKIVDFNTRFSGVSEKDFSPNSNFSAKTFSEVQQDLLNLFDANTILIGHGLDNDLKALRLVHKTIVDTSVIFSHSTGYPYRRSLKNLTKSFLKRDIQCGDKGHSSFEDSRACLELMMWKVRKDLRHWNYQ